MQLNEGPWIGSCRALTQWGGILVAAMSEARDGLEEARVALRARTEPSWRRTADPCDAT